MSNATVSPLMQPPQPSAPVWFVLVETGSLAGTRFPLSSRPGSLTLGREAGCTIRFDPNHERMVGRHHARIEMRDDGVYLIDTNSANGTFRNGDAVSEVRLQDGDRFQLGGEVEGAQGPWISIHLPVATLSPVAVHARPMSADSATVIIRPWAPDNAAPPPAVTHVLATAPHAPPAASHAPPAASHVPSAAPFPPAVPYVPPAATHAPPAFLSSPAAPPSERSPAMVPEPAALRYATLPPRAADPYPEPYHAPAVRHDTPVATPVVDPLHRQRREYLLRQIVVIAALLVLACGVGMVVGLRGATDAESDYATHGE